MLLTINNEEELYFYTEIKKILKIFQIVDKASSLKNAKRSEEKSFRSSILQKAWRGKGRQHGVFPFLISTFYSTNSLKRQGAFGHN